MYRILSYAGQTRYLSLLCFLSDSLSPEIQGEVLTTSSDAANIYLFRMTGPRISQPFFYCCGYEPLSDSMYRRYERKGGRISFVSADRRSSINTLGCWSKILFHFSPGAADQGEEKETFGSYYLSASRASGNIAWGMLEPTIQKRVTFLNLVQTGIIPKGLYVALDPCAEDV